MPRSVSVGFAVLLYNIDDIWGFPSSIESLCRIYFFPVCNSRGLGYPLLHSHIHSLHPPCLVSLSPQIGPRTNATSQRLKMKSSEYRSHPSNSRKKQSSNSIKSDQIKSPPKIRIPRGSARTEAPLHMPIPIAFRPATPASPAGRFPGAICALHDKSLWQKLAVPHSQSGDEPAEPRTGNP